MLFRLYGVFFALVISIYHRLEEAARPVIIEFTASAFCVAFVNYVIFRVSSLNLVKTPTVIAGFFSVIFYRFGIHNKKV